MNSFSDRLNKAMIEKNIKQSELAEKTGITKGAISQYLKGEYIPKQVNTYKIAKALGINPAWLMGKNVTMELGGETEYYLDEEAKQIAHELFINKDLRILFDAARDISKEDLKFVYEMVKKLKN